MRASSTIRFVIINIFCLDFIYSQSGSPIVQPFAFPSEVVKGQTVTTICAVLSGVGPYTFSWTRDGLLLVDSQPYISIQTSDELSLLTLRSVDRNRTGNYTCTVSSDYGKENITAPLYVSEPPEWLKTPKDVEVVLGENVKVDCSADGVPKPNITWTKVNGAAKFSSPAKDRPRYRTFNNGSLVLQNVRSEDGGLYQCTITNGKGQDLEKVITVIVLVPPQFREDFQMMKVRSSHSAVLQCEVTGDSPISVKWTKEYHAEAKNSEQKTQETPLPNGILSEFYITRVSRKDAGVYMCSASNLHGHRERTIKLVVLEPPASPSDIVVKQIGSEEVTIRWSAPYSGNSPVIRYILQYWMDTGAPPKLEEVSVGSDKITAVLENLRPGTPYVVRLVAENEFGQSTPSVPVKFATAEESPVGHPIDIYTEAKGSNALLIRWKPPPVEQRNGAISGYDLGYRERRTSDAYSYVDISSAFDYDSNDKTLLDYLLDHLKEGTEYEIIIRAYNSAGRGPLSAPVIARTKDKGPLSTPSLWAESTTATTMSLRWSVGSSQTNGIRYHFILYYRMDNSMWKEESINDPSKDSFILTGLEPNTLYEIFIQTVSGKESSSPSPVLKVTTSESESLLKPAMSQTKESEVLHKSYPTTTTLVISLSVVISAVVIVCVVAAACVYVVRVRSHSDFKADDMGSRHLSEHRSASEIARIPPNADYRYVDVNARPLLWCATPAPPANDYPSPYATLPLRCTPLSKRWQSEEGGLSLPCHSERSESLVNQRVDPTEEKSSSCHE